MLRFIIRGATAIECLPLDAETGPQHAGRAVIEVPVEAEERSFVTSEHARELLLEAVNAVLKRRPMPDRAAYDKQPVLAPFVAVMRRAEEAAALLLPD